MADKMTHEHSTSKADSPLPNSLENVSQIGDQEKNKNQPANSLQASDAASMDAAGDSKLNDAPLEALGSERKLLDEAVIKVRLIPNENINSKHDTWDKVDILAKLLSSVVIAGIGLLINSSIQRSQIASSEANSRAQIEVAKLKAQDDKKLQEGTLTAQLVQHLASKDSTEREIAIIALRESVPQQIYEATLLVLAKSDPDKDVRIRAIDNLAQSPAATVTNTLSNIASDAKAPADVRKAAEKSTQKSAISQLLTGNNEIIFSAAQFNTPAYEGSSEMAHGVFTYYLLQGLLGNADYNGDTTIDSGELTKYLEENIISYTRGKQIPFVTSSTESAIPLNKPLTPRSKIFVVGIGIADYADKNIVRPMFSIRDAASIAELYKSKMNAQAYLLLGNSATRANILSSIREATQNLRPDDTLIIYYGGQGLLLEGQAMLIPYDSQLNNPSSFISVNEINSYLEKANNKILYLDANFISLPQTR